MKKLIPIHILLASVTLICVPVFAFAQSPTSTPPGSTPKKTACEKITERVSARIAKFNEVQSAHDARYTQVESKLQEISTKLKARNIDTSAIDSQIAMLGQKKAKLQADKTAFISKLEESKQVACSNVQSQFKTKIAEAKVLQKTVVSDVKDIHDFTKIIRDSLKSIRSQIASSTARSV